MKNALVLTLALFCLIINSSIAQWINTGVTATTVNAITLSGSNVFISTNGGVPLSGVFRSTNNGINWTRVITGLSNDNIYSLAASGSNLFAGTYNGVYRSTDNGTNWLAAKNGLTYPTVWSLAILGTNLFAGTYYGGVYRSTDNGTSWTAVNTGLTNNYVYALTVLGSNLVAGTGGGVFISSNNGTSWTNAGFANNSVSALFVSGTSLYAGTYNGIYRSTDNGLNWTTLGTNGLSQTDIRAFTVHGTNIFAGTWGNGVFLLENNAAKWTAVNTGLPANPLTGGANSRVHAIAVAGAYLLIGIDDGFGGITDGLWRRPLSEIITSVENNENSLPIHFNLMQNYPNPFNPQTNINYQLPIGGHVTLKVYDTIGKEVGVLLNGEMPAGFHQIKFDASNLTSGIYFYQLRIGSFVSTKKLILIK